MLEVFEKACISLHKFKENRISGKLLNTETGFLYQRKQRVVQNEQYSWNNGSPRLYTIRFWNIFFLLYINCLSHDLASSTKLFADETFLFSVVKNTTKSRNDLKNDPAKRGPWAYENEP